MTAKQHNNRQGAIPLHNEIRARSDALGPILVAVLVNIGQLKGTPLLSWAPVDLTLLTFAALCTWCATRLLVARTNLLGAYLPAATILLIALSAGSNYWAPNHYASEKLLILLTVTALLSIAPFIVIFTDQQRVTFFRALVVIAIIVATLLILNPAAVSEYTNRVALDGSNTIGTARILGAGLVISYAFIIRGGAVRSLISHSACILLFGWGMLSTGSRGPFVAAAIAVTVITLLTFARKGGKKRLPRILVTASLGAGAVGAVATTDGAARVFSFFSGVRDTSTQAREVMWHAGIEAGVAHPLGLGLGQFGVYPSAAGIDEYPHNILIETFAEAGWLAVIVLFLLLAHAVVAATKSALSTGAFATAGVLVYAVSNAMVSGDVNGNRLLWATVGIAIAQVYSEGRTERANDISRPGFNCERLG